MILRSAFFLVLLCANLAQASHQIVSGECVSPPFESGEMARFEVHMGPMKVGEGTGVVRSVQLSEDQSLLVASDPFEERMWVIGGRGISTGMVSLFYKVDDTIESWLNFESLLPRFREIRIRETNERTLRRVTFDHSLGLTHFWRDRQFYRRKPEREKVTARQHDLVSGAHDILSLFLRLRCLNVDSERSFHMPVHENGKNFLVEVRVERMERIPTLWGMKDALRVGIRVFFDGELRSKRPYRAWVSSDERRIPLRLVADLPFADLEAELVGYRRSHFAEIEGELDPTFVETCCQRGNATGSVPSP